MKRLLLILSPLLLFIGCEKPIVENPPAKQLEVKLSLTFEESENIGKAKNYDYERDFSEITVLLFNNEGLLLDKIKPKVSENQISFELENKGTYEVFLAANTGINYENALVDSTSTVDDYKRLMISADITNKGKLPLISQSGVKFTLGDVDVFLNDVKLVTPSARFDIINAVDAMTITKVTLINRALSSAYDNTSETSEKDLEDKIYDGLSILGNSNDPAIYSGEVYSYENSNNQHPTQIEIIYSMNGKEFVEIHYFEEKMIQRGKLYTLTLVNLGETTVEYHASNWQSTKGIVVEVSGKTEQENLNDKLAINRFASTNVSSIDIENKTVILCNTNNSFDIDNEDVSYLWSWNDIYATAVFYAPDGKAYRLPSVDEMSLIFPKRNYLLSFSDEKTTLDYEESLPDLFGETGNGGGGLSDFKTVITGEPGGTTPYRTQYAIRFRNTKQAAAYSYKWMKLGKDIDDAVLRIRVKALSDSSISIEDVANDEYFESEYFELLLPASGKGSGIYADPMKILHRGELAYYWSSTEKNDYAAVCLSISRTTANSETSAQKNQCYALRLVRAE